VAHEALAAVATRGASHQVASSRRIAHQRAAGTGRPTPRTPLTASAWPIPPHVQPAHEARGPHQPVQACGGLGPQSGASAWSDAEVLAADTGPSGVDGGCRLRQDPRCFVASVLVKQPSRLAGLLLGMPRAWLVSAVAPRRLRQPGARHHETVPHPSNPPRTSPT
jgi:hypothetical protein